RKLNAALSGPSRSCRTAAPGSSAVDSKTRRNHGIGAFLAATFFVYRRHVRHRPSSCTRLCISLSCALSTVLFQMFVVEQKVFNRRCHRTTGDSGQDTL